VDRLVDVDQVVAAGEFRIGGVTQVECDPVLDTASFEMLARGVDRSVAEM
jgi:hypothetical protein